MTVAERIKAGPTVQPKEEDAALNKIYMGVIALECMDPSELSRMGFLDVEMLRDRLSRFYDRARGIQSNATPPATQCDHLTAGRAL